MKNDLINNFAPKLSFHGKTCLHFFFHIVIIRCIIFVRKYQLAIIVTFWNKYWIKYFLFGGQAIVWFLRYPWSRQHSTSCFIHFELDSWIFTHSKIKSESSSTSVTFNSFPLFKQNFSSWVDFLRSRDLKKNALKFETVEKTQTS